jgi:cytochrome P450
MNFLKSVHYFLTAKMFGVSFPLLVVFGPIGDLMKGREHLRRSYQKGQERLKMPEDDKRKDFWTYISRQNQEKEDSMSVKEIEVNMAILIPAGSDTIATTLSGCCYLLLKNADTLSRIRKDLTEEFSSESEITTARLASLPYIKAVIDEALRMYPPLSGDLRRAVPPRGHHNMRPLHPRWHDCQRLRTGSLQQCQQFCSAAQVHPERWLTTDERPEWAKNDHLEVCQPFSVGPRNCIAMNLAYVETKLILARLLFRFNLELIGDAFEIEKQRVFIMREKPTLRVRLSHRTNIEWIAVLALSTAEQIAWHWA